MNTKDVIKSQYRASLDMLRQAVIKCPNSLWDDREYKNVFWQVAYHALFYVHLYVQPSREGFVPWARDRQGYHDLSNRQVGEPYSREDALEYLDLCQAQVEQQVAVLDLDGPSGFGWLPFSKLELQFYSIRHLQQHIGELCERLGATGAIDVDWVGSKSRQ